MKPDADERDRFARLAKWLDAAVECIVAGLLIFTPLAFGTTQAWSRDVFVTAVAVAAAVVAVKHAVRANAASGGPVGSWVYVPIAVFFALCAAQISPLPATVLNVISPGTLRLKTSLLSDVPNVGRLLGHSTLSFYRHATLSQIVLLAAVTAVFLIVIDVYREPARIKRLLAVMTLMGLGVAGLAAYQNLTGSTVIYAGVHAVTLHTGPFLNYSHFSQFENLSVGAALALVLVGVADLAGFYRTPVEIAFALRRPQAAMIWVATATCLIGPVTVLLSMSRMGMISMLVATGVTGIMLAWSGSRQRSLDAGGRSTVVIILAVLVFAVLLYVGFDTVYARLATVEHFDSTGGSREHILRDLLPVFRQFPLFGVGLGAHELFFPAFNHLNLASIATHAENEYAQLMEETGALGVVLAGAFVAWIVRNYLAVTRRPREPIAYAAFGLGFGLLAILIHSASDFGQHLPANAELTAISAGLLFNLSRLNGNAAAASPAVESRFKSVRLFAGAAVMLIVIAAGVAAARFTHRARLAEAESTSAQEAAFDLQADNWQGTDSAYVAAIAPAARAADVEPNDVTYRYWTDVYRWHAIARKIDPATGAIQMPVAAIPFAARIADDLQSIRPLCPTYGPPVSLLGQINFSVLGHTNLGREQILKAVALTPYDRSVNYVAGALAIHDQDWPAAQTAFDRYRLLGGSLHDYTDLLLRAGHPEIVYAQARENRADLDYLVSRMPPADPNWSAWIARCRADAAKLLDAEASGPDASAESLAQLAATKARQGHPLAAIPLYQRALQSNYGRTDWRLALAQAELTAGKPKDAARDANVVLQLRPQSTEAQAIVDTARQIGN